MATADHTKGASTGAAPEPTEFELRRGELVADIGDSLETVLQQINALNRSLEGIIAIGNDFSSVEALWSQFETIMGRDNDDGTRESGEAQDADHSTAGQGNDTTVEESHAS
ncbi:putative dash complex subunit dad1 [Phaeomoniella chlamydospora]|uniref:DASH complex subunit DAD1 n=1 Tax=Phaeomoniella chlamydospora TaxID=158046 RepID=A0A0G2GU52_PHACM|nr:putative dash complex subunit dad1 [Phaeomoniella chlamydospora]